MVKPHTIDDVPVLALTLHSPRYDHYTLRRLASQLDDAVKNIPEVAETKLIGGARRQVRVLFDPARLAARGLTATEIIPKLQQANLQSYSGTLQSLNTEILLQTGRFLTSAKEIGRIVVGVYNNRPVYLDEVAGVVDGPEDPTNYVLFGSGKGQPEEAAVTLSLAKRPGANAVQVVETVLAKIETLKGTLIPSDVTVSVTRNYGETAAEKSNELLLHMGIAVFGVTLLILFFLGWRESVIVILAIPSTLALTLLLFYLYGYTLNRITLFALIPPPAAGKHPQIRPYHRHRGGERGGQPDHPRHLGGDRRHSAHGLCRRADGPLHAADPHRLLRGDDFFAAHRLHRYPLGRRTGAEKEDLPQQHLSGPRAHSGRP